MTEGTIDALVSLGVTKKIANEIGCRLREARQNRGQTTAAIAARIRVREHYLVAMESGDWEVLPAGVNGRGLIRIYARDLNVSIPELENKTVGGVSDPKPPTPLPTRQESVSVRSRTTPIPPVRPGSRNVTRTKPRDPVDTMLRSDEDDHHALDASSPELAHFLGINPVVNASTAQPSRPKAVVVMENDVPVVRAEVLAEEMFIGTSPVSEKTSPTAADAPTSESEVTTPEVKVLTPVAETPASPEPTPKAESQAQSPLTTTMSAKTDPILTAKIPTPPAVPETPPPAAVPPERDAAPEPSSEAPLTVSPTVSEEPPGEIPPLSNVEPLPDEGIVLPPLKLHTKREEAPQVESPSRNIKWMALVAGLVLIAGGIAIYQLSSESENRDVPPAVSAESDAPENELAAKPAAAPAEESAALAAAASPTVAVETPMATPTAQANTTPVPTPTATTPRLKKITLKVLSPVSMTIRIDGKPFFTGGRSPGSLELEFQKTADIYVDDGSKVTLDYDGWENHGTMGWPGRKRRVVINAEVYAGQGHGSL